LYSAAAGGGISIADLFAAGVVPAILLMISVMLTAYVIARRRGYATAQFPGMRTVAMSFVAALPGLLLVLVIFGGIRAGIFTAVESASVAVLYAVVVTALAYRRLDFRQFKTACASAAHTAGIILFVISAAATFGWLLAYLEVPAQVVAGVRELADDATTILIAMNVVLLVLGTFMDMAPLIIICTPIFLPVATAFGVSPLQFGVMLILNAGIGLITPPVGSVLFVGTAIGKISIAETMRTIWPFYLAGLVVLALVTLWPALSLWLPGVLR
ncbi:MAG TPA: TRAP transporter large permease, partial [Gammaproteobacteria bacterium]|nr:TRAP transporter large permease [Gammaproteobacteria bacterium]